jgi:hypothetical protein
MTEAARDTAAEWQTVAIEHLVDVAEEMMRFTGTIVTAGAARDRPRPFAGTVDGAWAIVNQHIGKSFWSSDALSSLSAAR